jgi:hypothetical protein
VEKSRRSWLTRRRRRRRRLSVVHSAYMSSWHNAVEASLDAPIGAQDGAPAVTVSVASRCVPERVMPGGRGRRKAPS